MAVVGFFIGGAANIISATITADLGQQEALKGNKEGLSTVTGIVDGTGSTLVPLIQEKFDWHFVFLFVYCPCKYLCQFRISIFKDNFRNVNFYVITLSVL